MCSVWRCLCLEEEGHRFYAFLDLDSTETSLWMILVPDELGAFIEGALRYGRTTLL